MSLIPRRTFLGYLFSTAIAASFGLGISPATAQNNQQLLSQIERSFDGLRTAQGRFTQIDGAGNVQRGTIYLSRPGRIRFEYDNSPIVIISNGDIVAQVDQELEQVDFRKLYNTPLSILLAKHVQFREPYVITNVQQTPDSAMVTMLDNRNPQDGTITLIFRRDNLELFAWQIVDKQGHNTTVQLENMVYGAAVRPIMFIVPKFDRPEGNK